MRVAPSRGAWKQLDSLFRFGVAGHLGDDELLGRFVGRRDDVEAAEAAFAVLVERHGPMVLGVCRRVLRDRHEAEDAFQATFLVLARKAASIARREQLANWLHGVACRTALDVRARSTRRKAREQKAHAMSPSEARPAEDADLDELRAIVDEELARLPERYRGAVILCELEGLSRQAAAQRLGIPEGTLSSRLARAKDLLRHRLTRRGLAPATIVVDAALAPETQAILIPSSLAGSTIQAAARVAAGISLAEAASTSVATLTQGVLKAMLIAKFKGLVTGLTLATVVTTGIGVLAQSPGHPDGDRLGALERKLDRILEALGGPRNDVPPAQATIQLDDRRARLSDARPDNRNDELATIQSDGGRARGVRIPQPPPVPTPPAPPSSDRAPSVPPPPPATVPAPLGSPSLDLAGRVDALERRLAAMERRLGEMEHRLVPALPPAGARISRDDIRPDNVSRSRLHALPSPGVPPASEDQGPRTQD
jgi:RNA polymerase sigma factor (sigma-70 family)